MLTAPRNLLKIALKRFFVVPVVVYGLVGLAFAIFADNVGGTLFLVRLSFT